MPVTIDVKPNLSAFREVSEDDLAAAIEAADPSIDQCAAAATARLLIARFWVIPR